MSRCVPARLLFEEFSGNAGGHGWTASVTNPGMNFQAEARPEETLTLNGVRLQRVLLMSAFGAAAFGDRSRLRLICGWAVERASDDPGGSRVTNRTRVRFGGVLVFQRGCFRQPSRMEPEESARWAGRLTARILTGGTGEWLRSHAIMEEWAGEKWPAYWTSHAVMEFLRLRLAPGRLAPGLHRLKEIPHGPWRVLLSVASPVFHHQALQSGFRITDNIGHLCRNFRAGRVH